MAEPAPTTCWTLIQGAAAGQAAARAEFARRYERVVDAYLGARWRRGPLAQDTHDAIQDVFLECFKEDGALGRAHRGGAAGFRGFLLGVARNVAARYEERRGRGPDPLGSRSQEGDDEDHEDPARAFERAWAAALVDEAGLLQEARARLLGGEALLRLEILRLRFREGLPVREVATMLGREPKAIHHQYAVARKEFQDALREVVSFHVVGGDGAVDEECRLLLQSLGE